MLSILFVFMYVSFLFLDRHLHRNMDISLDYLCRCQLCFTLKGVRAQGDFCSLFTKNLKKDDQFAINFGEKHLHDCGASYCWLLFLDIWLLLPCIIKVVHTRDTGCRNKTTHRRVISCLWVTWVLPLVPPLVRPAAGPQLHSYEGKWTWSKINNWFFRPIVTMYHTRNILTYNWHFQMDK